MQLSDAFGYDSTCHFERDSEAKERKQKAGTHQQVGQRGVIPLIEANLATERQIKPILRMRCRTNGPLRRSGDNQRLSVVPSSQSDKGDFQQIGRD